jgi:hypothetical protein
VANQNEGTILARLGVIAGKSQQKNQTVCLDYCLTKRFGYRKEFLPVLPVSSKDSTRRDNRAKDSAKGNKAAPRLPEKIGIAA